jgi:hypothetical protein
MMRENQDPRDWVGENGGVPWFKLIAASEIGLLTYRRIEISSPTPCFLNITIE